MQQLALETDRIPACLVFLIVSELTLIVSDSWSQEEIHDVSVLQLEDCVSCLLYHCSPHLLPELSSRSRSQSQLRLEEPGAGGLRHCVSDPEHLSWCESVSAESWRLRSSVNILSRKTL